MNVLLAYGISIGVLAAIFMAIDYVLNLQGVPYFLQIISFATFVGWATYYAIGDKHNGMIKGWCCNANGAFWGFMTVLLYGLTVNIWTFPGVIVFWLFICVSCIIVCLCANVKLLSFIPGGFFGMATFYGFANIKGDFGFEVLIACIISLWFGGLFGWLSDLGAGVLIGKPKDDAAE